MNPPDTITAAERAAAATQNSDVAQVTVDNGWAFAHQVYLDVTSSYGLFVAILLIVLVFIFWRYLKQVEDRLLDKDAEIRRMAKDMVKLRDQFLSLADTVNKKG